MKIFTRPHFRTQVIGTHRMHAIIQQELFAIKVFGMTHGFASVQKLEHRRKDYQRLDHLMTAKV